MPVASAPVRFYAQDPSAITKEAYYFCRTRGCDTVYFDAEGTPLTRDALTVRIGVKEERAPHLVCYCFGHTEEAMEAELRIHGKTSIPERIRAVIPDATIWTLTIDEPGNDFLKSREQLRRFREHARQLMDRIKARHGEDAVLHLFPAAPEAIAVEFGRILMPKADLAVRIYDEHKSRGGFVHALDLDACGRL